MMLGRMINLILVMEYVRPLADLELGDGCKSESRVAKKLDIDHQ
jgi:hypothetical protein